MATAARSELERARKVWEAGEAETRSWYGREVEALEGKLRASEARERDGALQALEYRAREGELLSKLRVLEARCEKSEARQVEDSGVIGRVRLEAEEGLKRSNALTALLKGQVGSVIVSLPTLPTTVRRSTCTLYDLTPTLATLPSPG